MATRRGPGLRCPPARSPVRDDGSINASEHSPVLRFPDDSAHGSRCRRHVSAKTGPFRVHVPSAALSQPETAGLPSRSINDPALLIS